MIVAVVTAENKLFKSHCGWTPITKSTPAVPTSSTTNTPAPFGVRSPAGEFASPTTAAINSLRGGGVEEPATLADMDALVIQAGSQDKLIVIDFHATWCGPCKMIAPVFKELSESIADVMFVKVDVDENPDTAAKYSVSAMPTFIFIKGGEVVERLMGANPARLQELINEHK